MVLGWSFPKCKKNLSLKGTLEVYLFRHLVASLLIVDDLLVQGSGEHGTVSSLLVGMEQASGRADVPKVPISKRQQHLQVLFVPGQESWMRSGRSGPWRAKFKFS